MSEAEILRQQIAALQELLTIKDQTISALRARPQHWGNYPYYPQPYWAINQAGGFASVGAVNNGISSSGITSISNGGASI